VSEIIRIAAIALHMLFAFGVIVLVLAHSGKDAGLSGAFGVGSSSFGSTQIMERNLTRFTIMCSAGLVGTTVLLGFLL
jgi:preprotein translocase subunit SecG